MEHVIKQIKKGAKHTRMSLTEKAEMKSALLRHVKANPVSIGVHERSVPSPFFNINNLRNKKSISILVIGGLLMGGSVSFAAEGAVPGDVLFPVKVHVNESVRGAVAVTPKAKAEWEVRLVARRLEEVEKLAITPNVPHEVKQTAEQNLANYTHNVENRIAKFDGDNDGEDAVGTASNLSEVLGAHEHILLGLSAGTKATAGSATTTSISLATTTADATVTAPSVNGRPIENALEKVRGARGNAEKRHKELKEKYHTGEIKAENDNMRDSLPVTSPSTQIPATTNIRASGKRTFGLPIIRVDAPNGKTKNEQKEEIRSSINAQATSTSQVTEVRIESTRTEGKQRQGTHETPKADSND